MGHLTPVHYGIQDYSSWPWFCQTHQVIRLGQKPHHTLCKWSYELCCAGPPKMDRSWWRVLTKKKKISNNTWSTGKGNGKPVFLPREPHEQYEKAKDMTPEDEPPRSVGVPYATGEKWRNSSRRNEEPGPKWIWCSDLDVSESGESKVRCSKEQYFIGTWNVRSMNQGKLDVVRQEMARVNINILRISELKWMRMGKFNSDDHYIYYCGQEPLEEME